MNSKIIIVIVTALAVAGGAALALNSSKSDQNNMPATMDMSTQAIDIPAQSSTTATPTEPVSADKVTIKDFAYGPAAITVKKGTTVTWTNQDAIRHDVVPDKSTDEFKPSELLSRGQSYSVTFNTAGTYSYHCTPHPQMTGTVTVIE